METRVSDSRNQSLGIAVVIGAMVLGIISIVGLFLPSKSLLLHFPALVISVFFIGVGVSLLFGLSVKR